MISNYMAIKTCSVGVSSYILFKELRGFSTNNSAGLALSASVLTLLLEKIRPKSKETNNWFECEKIDFEHKDIAKRLHERGNQLDFLLKIIKIQLIAGVATLFYSIFYGSPQQDLIAFISENKLKWIPMATLIGPVVEEVLFRGFLKEWMEVGCDLIDRYIYAISKESQHHISNVAQATLFGACHMISKNKTENALIFASTGILGIMQGLWKRIEEGSLRTPINQHIKQNTLNLLITLCLIPILKQVRVRVL
jgi:membrane protease YdiL (CAAX protease family)